MATTRATTRAPVVQVETCRPLGDAAKPRAWSKYAKDSSAYSRLHPDQSDQEAPSPKKAKKRSTFGSCLSMKPSLMDAAKKEEVDPKLDEFLEATGKSELIKVLS